MYIIIVSFITNIINKFEVFIILHPDPHLEQKLILGEPLHGFEKISRKGQLVTKVRLQIFAVEKIVMGHQ